LEDDLQEAVLQLLQAEFMPFDEINDMIRPVCSDPHLGQGTCSSEGLTSSSNCSPQSLHRNSYIGIAAHLTSVVIVPG
jgi:hypothetical protein